MKPVIGIAPLLLTMMFLTDLAARAPGFSPLSPDESRIRLGHYLDTPQHID